MQHTFLGIDGVGHGDDADDYERSHQETDIELVEHFLSVNSRTKNNNLAQLFSQTNSANHPRSTSANNYLSPIFFPFFVCFLLLFHNNK